LTREYRTHDSVLDTILAGLTYAAVWAIAPASVARPVAGAAVATAAVVAMIYCARVAKRAPTLF
jgi:hypothetical protein